MKQDENVYSLNHRLWYKFNFDTNLYIVCILQKVYRMYKILYNVQTAVFIIIYLRLYKDYPRDL
jgi:hypothetical protein